ncbi:LPS translocon maturation chaperone LptM [Kinneretia aquatilis]
MKANNEQLRSVGPRAAGPQMPGSLRRAGASLTLCLSLSLLGACGQKGPLYLPQPQAQAQSQAPAPSTQGQAAKAPSPTASAARP